MSNLVPSDIIKTYPPRGPMQQYRFQAATAFNCFRCGASKKSKLITVYNSDWNLRLCNGCYGCLLSIYDVKAGTQPDDEKAEELARILLSLLNQQQVQEAQRLLEIAEKRSTLLSANGIRFLATADFVAHSLKNEKNLDWSPAIIGICKAVELEIIERLFMPLTSLRGNNSLAQDTKDKDFGRIAKFIKDGTGKPPELGSFAHFLQTVINSQKRRASSVLIGTFIDELTNMVGSNWILDSNGLYRELITLTTKYRNRAAHLDDLGRQEYENCRSLVIGDDGLLWRLIKSTKMHK